MSTTTGDSTDSKTTNKNTVSEVKPTEKENTVSEVKPTQK